MGSAAQAVGYRRYRIPSSSETDTVGSLVELSRRPTVCLPRLILDDCTFRDRNPHTPTQACDFCNLIYAKGKGCGGHGNLHVKAGICIACFLTRCSVVFVEVKGIVHLFHNRLSLGGAECKTTLYFPASADALIFSRKQVSRAEFRPRLRKQLGLLVQQPCRLQNRSQKSDPSSASYQGIIRTRRCSP